MKSPEVISEYIKRLSKAEGSADVLKETFGREATRLALQLLVARQAMCWALDESGMDPVEFCCDGFPEGLQAEVLEKANA